MIRALILLLLLSGLGWGLVREQGRGRFARVNDTWVDFLLANSRGRFKPDPAKLGDVVFVRLREEDKKEYETWPPSPGDYSMIMKGLAAFEPSVLVFADPLAWPEPKPDSIPGLAQALLPVPGVVLAAEAAGEGEADEASLAPLSDHLPVLTRLGGEGQLPALPPLVKVPEPALLPQKDVGIVGGPKLALAYHRKQGGAVPSLALAAASLATHTPYANQRLRTGPGAGVHVGNQTFVPFEKDGSLKPEALAVPSVNGLELMTANLVDADPAVAKTLGKGKTVILGMDHDAKEPSPARTQAEVLAGLMTLPRVRELGRTAQIIIWVLCVLAGLSLLLLPKRRATARTLILLFSVLLVAYVAFQIALVWCPPTIPAALLLAAGVFARLFGHDPDKVRSKSRRSGKFYRRR